MTRSSTFLKRPCSWPDLYAATEYPAYIISIEPWCSDFDGQMLVSVAFVGSPLEDMEV